MRRMITLGVYVLMIALGVWLAYEWLIRGSRGIIFMAGGFLAVFGGYLLWADFLSPNREKTE
jgi:branched-subunit amino acid ABC-type transport system permease component